MAVRYTDEDIASAILTGGTITKASEILGLNRCRLSKRANSENVQKLLHQKRAELFKASCSRLVEASKEAIEVLTDTMHDHEASPSQKIRCAEIILTNAFRSYEMIDLSNDLRQLREEFEAIKERR